MIFSNPIALLLLLAIVPVVIAHRTSRSSTSSGRKFASTAFSIIAIMFFAFAAAGVETQGAPRVARIAIANGDSATTQATLTAWRASTPWADPWRVVRADGVPILGAPASTEIPQGSTEPDLSRALLQAIAVAPTSGPLDIALVGTEGHDGPDLAPIGEALARRGARLHVRTTPSTVTDAILSVSAPSHVRIAEPFDVSVDVRLASAGSIKFSVREGDTEVGTHTAVLDAGVHSVPVTVRPKGQGDLAFVVTATVAGSSNATLTERFAVYVNGTISVAIASGAEGGSASLTQALGPGFTVREVSLNDLGSNDSDVTILDDIPARAIPTEAHGAVRASVLERGSGLLVTGANASMGPGGYADTPIGDLLPVTFPQEEERRDPSVGLVIVIDTSGSMSGSRIDLAKEVARLAIKRLLPHDKIGMVEFYGARRWAAPLQSAANAIEIQRALNRLQAGGGTIIYEALEESYYALLEARTRFRHALVITDGGVESGPFEALARRMADSGILVHTVLVGPGGNSPFLQDLSRWGRGRFYACPNRYRLPDLSFREPQASPRPAVESGALVIARPHASEATAALSEAKVSIGLAGALSLRPGADLLLAVGGSRPLLAAWDQGLGRTAALATELLGPGVAPWRADATHPAMLADLVRSLARGHDADRPKLEITSYRNAAWIRTRGIASAPVIMSGTFAAEAVAQGDGSFLLAVPVSDSPVHVRASTPDNALAEGSVIRPLPRMTRLGDASDSLGRLARMTGGTTEGPLPTTFPSEKRRVDRRTLSAILGVTAFLIALFIRRAPERARVMSLGALAFVLLSSPSAFAQTSANTKPQDPVVGAIERSVIGLESTLKGMADGPAKVALLDAMGRESEAIALIDVLLAGTALDEPTRLNLEIRLALLAPDRATPRALARLTGTEGSGAPAILRRALEVERHRSPADAARAWELAATELPLARDRRFAYARFLTSMRRAGDLKSVRERLSARIDSDVNARRIVLQALRELGASEEALALAISGDGALSEEALGVAVETGRPDLAISTAKTLLAKDPNDLATRALMARTLAEQQDRDEADRVLGAGVPLAKNGGTLLYLFSRADEWKLPVTRAAALDALRARGTDGALEAALSESKSLQDQGKVDPAKELLRSVTPKVTDAGSRSRLAEAFEGLGANDDAIVLWKEAYEATKAEDAGSRYATLLEASGKPDDAETSLAIWKSLWKRAGSAARRTQAQERVLDGAARNGTLADIALELEEALSAPDAQDRDMILDALLALYARAKDSSGGLAAIAAWEKFTGRHVDALERRSALHQMCDEPVAHEKTLKELLRVDPEREIEWRRLIALSLLDRGRAVLARDAVTDLLNRPDRTEETDEFAAGILRFIGRPEEAAEAYVSGLKIHPDRIETLLLLADAWKASGTTERGINLFKDILSRECPDDLLVLAADGLLNLEADPKSLRAAARAVSRRLAEFPGRVHLLRVLQDLFETLKDDASRLRALEETVVVAGEQRAAFVRELAEERLRANDRKGGADIAREFLLLGMEAPPALFLTLGEALLKDGDRRGAEAAFSHTALGLDGASSESKIAKLYEDTGAWTDAERVRRRQLLRAPEDITAQVALAKALEKQGRNSEAAPLYISACRRKLEKDADVNDLPSPTPAMVGASSGLIVALSARGGARDGSPQVDELLQAISRIRPRHEMVAPILDLLVAATTRGPSGIKLSALRRLTTLCQGLGTDDARALVRSREDAMLADVMRGGGTATRPTPESSIARAIGEARLAQGDLVGASAAAAALISIPFDRFTFRVMLIGGRDKDAETLLDRATDTDLAWGTTLLASIKGPAVAKMRLEGLRDAALRRPTALADDYVALARAIDPNFDARPFEQEALRTMIADWKAGVASIQLLSYIEARPDLTTSLKSSALKLVAEDTSSVSRTLAPRLIVAGRGVLPDADLGPLVEKQVKEASSPYIAADRLKDLGLVDAAKREALLDDALRKFRSNDANQIPLALLSETTRVLPPELLARLVAAVDPKAIDLGDVFTLRRLGKAPHLPPEIRSALLDRLMAGKKDDPSIMAAMAQMVPDETRRPALARAAIDAAIRKGDLDVLPAVAQSTLGLLTQDDLQALANLPADGSPASLLARGLALGRLGDHDAFSKAIMDAAKSRPDDVALLRQAVEALKTQGRPEDAAALLVNYLDNGAKAYPYWIGEAATMLLEIGKPDEAAAALRRPMEGVYVSNLEGLRLRVAALTESSDIREEMVRDCIAAISPQSQFVRIGVLNRARGVRLDDALRLLTPQAPLPTNRDEALNMGDGDALGFVAQGGVLATRILIALPAESRGDRTDLIRAVVTTAVRENRLAGFVHEMEDRLSAAPADTMALASLAYAKFAGATVTGDPVSAWGRRLLTATAVPASTIDAAELALATGDKTLAVALVNRMGVIRSAGSGSREVLRRLLVLAKVAPERLPKGPSTVRGGRSIDNDHEGQTLAVLGASGRLAADVLTAWRPAYDVLNSQGMSYESRLFLWPWAGWCLRAGKVDDARSALTIMDVVSETTPPSWAFAAALPPIAEWADPASTSIIAKELVARARTEDGTHRADLVRLGMILVRRLTDANRKPEADALRSELKAAAPGLRLGTFTP